MQISNEVVFSWDVVNWSRCLTIWQRHLIEKPLRCLEIGCGPGGISLWLASLGHDVICTDLENPEKRVLGLHRKYEVSGKISYRQLNAVNMPFVEEFDIVITKSVLGGIWAHCGEEGLSETLQGIHRALKPGGKYLFAENLQASRFHMYCRGRFLSRSKSWKYPTIAKLLEELRIFSEVKWQTHGFLGTFGIWEWQRRLLGHVDGVLSPVLPKDWRYLMFGCAGK